MLRIDPIDVAIEELKKNPVRNGDITRTAKKYSIHPRTLNNHYHGVNKRRDNINTSGLLSAAQEQSLVQWILRLSNIGLPAPPALIWQGVVQIRAQHKLPTLKGVGKNWVTKFRHRHATVLRSGEVVPIDKLRHWAAKKQVLMQYFTLVSVLLY